MADRASCTPAATNYDDSSSEEDLDGELSELSGDELGDGDKMLANQSVAARSVVTKRTVGNKRNTSSAKKTILLTSCRRGRLR
jgi:hypothetical protein